MILVTGATGFLGSHVAVRLLRDGNKVLLPVRGNGRRGAAERAREILDWHGVGPAERARVRVFEADLTKPGLGLETGVRKTLLEAEEIVHCASETTFAERKRNSVEAVNVAGLGRLLDFAAEGGCAVFHHMSTAYVFGRRTGLCREELVEEENFFNVYEETKCRGERTVWDRCRAEGIVPFIHRPSIVYGDSRTGRSLSFKALYHPIKSVLFLKEAYEEDIQLRGGTKAAEAGVRREADGSLCLPLRIKGDGSGINIIPVDFIVEALAAIREEADGGGVFHIVNDETERLADLVEHTKKMFGLTGLSADADEIDRGAASSPPNPLQAILDQMLGAYAPYLEDKRIFDTARLRPILERRGLRFPRFDYPTFERCISYAIRCDWGAKVLPD